ncbi:MAG: hypothetical protein WCO12_03135 [bacterium]
MNAFDWICAFVCSVVIAVPFAGGVFMALSLMTISLVLWDLLRSVLTWNLIGGILSAVEDVREMIGGVWGLIPGLAFIYLIGRLIYHNLF